MKNSCKHFIPFLLAVLIALPVWALTIQGGDGSSMQGGSTKVQGSSLIQFPASLIARLDATISASYPGSGDDWLDVNGDSAYAFHRGENSATNAKDPTFLGMAGDKDAAFLFDGGDRVTIKANTAFIERIHKTDETSLGVTFQISFYWPLYPQSGLTFFFGDEEGSTHHGFKFYYNNSSGNFIFDQVANVGSSANTTVASGVTIQPGTFNTLMLSIQKTQANQGTYRFKFNDNGVETGVTALYNATTTNATKKFQFSGIGSSAVFPAGVKVKGFTLFSDSLSSAQEDSVQSLLETAYGNTFPTSVETVRHLFWNSKTDLLLADTDSLDVSSENYFNNDQGFMVMRFIAPSTFVNSNYLLVGNDGTANESMGLEVRSLGEIETVVNAGGVSKSSSSNNDILIAGEIQSVAMTWKSGEVSLLSGGKILTNTYSGDPNGMNIINFSARNGNLDAKDLTFYDAYVGNTHKTPAELEQYIFKTNDVKAAAGGQSLMDILFSSFTAGNEDGKQNFRISVHAGIDESNTVTFVKGSTGGSAAAKTSNAIKYWWDNDLNVAGPSLTDFKTDMDTVGFTPNILLWSQGEADSDHIPASTTKQQYKDALLSTFNDIRSTYGNMPVVIQPIGRRTSFSNAGGIQAVRDVQFELAAENSWIYLGPDSYDLTLADNVHPDDASAAILGTRWGNRVLDVLGFTVANAVGPAISSASRIGTAVTITVDHDSGSDITPATGIEGFHFFDDASEITINSAVRTDTNKITLTLASAPTGAETLYYIYDDEDPLTLANVVKDNAATSMPLQSTKLGL